MRNQRGERCLKHGRKFVFFQFDRTSAEVASSLVNLSERVGHRLKDGMIYKWYTDNDLGFDGSEVQKVSEHLILSHERTVANEHHNPVAENHWRNLEGMMRRTLAHADEAPACLWSWVARQMDILMYYFTTKAHNPPVSPYRFSNPDAELANLSWVHPVLCDCTVHLSERDQQGKLSHTGAEACYLGRDTNRQADICYVPSLSRIATFQVVEWRPSFFTVCQGITADTPVEYYEINEFRVGAATAAMLPTRFRKRRAQVIQTANSTSVEKEGAATTPSNKEGADSLLVVKADNILVVNAAHIRDAINSLEKEGEAAFVAHVIANVTGHSTRSPPPPSPPATAPDVLDSGNLPRAIAADESMNALYNAACDPCDALISFRCFGLKPAAMSSTKTAAMMLRLSCL